MKYIYCNNYVSKEVVHCRSSVVWNWPSLSLIRLLYQLPTRVRLIADKVVTFNVLSRVLMRVSLFALNYFSMFVMLFFFFYYYYLLFLFYPLSPKMSLIICLSGRGFKPPKSGLKSWDGHHLSGSVRGTSLISGVQRKLDKKTRNHQKN